MTARELIEMAHSLTAELAKSKVSAENFMVTLDANVENERLSDAGFRDFVRNSIPVVIFPRVAPLAADMYVDRAAPRTKSELVREVRKASLDLHRNRFMAVLDEFSLASFSAAQLSEMPESRLRELLEEIRRSSR